MNAVWRECGLGSRLGSTGSGQISVGSGDKFVISAKKKKKKGFMSKNHTNNEMYRIVYLGKNMSTILEKAVKYEYDVDEVLNCCAMRKPSSLVAVHGLVTTPKASQVLRRNLALHRSWRILPSLPFSEKTQTPRILYTCVGQRHVYFSCASKQTRGAFSVAWSWR